MLFRINQQIFQQYPDLKIGVVIVKGFNNARHNSNIHSLLRGACAQSIRKLATENIDIDSKITCWDRAFGNFGANPIKKMPLIKQLMKYMQLHGEIPTQNPMKDLANYFSVKHRLPILTHDIDWFCGDLHLRFTDKDEAFRPHDSIEVQHTNEGEVTYADNGGVIQRLWNHLECERAKVTSRTVNAVMIIEDMSEVHLDEFAEIVREVQNGAIKYLGGQIEPYLMTTESNAIDFGVEGRRNADDSRIPQQEIAHFKEN